MKKIAFVLLLSHSLTAVAEDQLLTLCKQKVAAVTARVEGVTKRFNDYDELVKANKAEAAKITRLDQAYLEDLLLSSFKEMPKITSYLQTAKGIAPNSPYRTLLPALVDDVTDDVKAEISKLDRNPGAYQVDTGSRDSISLVKDYNINGLQLRIYGQGVLRQFDGQLHLLIVTSAHSGAPIYGTMTEGMKIVNLETGVEVQRLSRAPLNWGGPIAKKALEEPFTKWQTEAPSMMDTNLDSPDIQVCKAYIGQQQGQ